MHFAKFLMSGLLIATVFLSVPNDSVKASDGASELEKAELFDAIDNGLVSVKFIPLGPEKANLIIENLGDAPMRLRLPETFAGVPVLGQFAGGGGGGLGGGGGGLGGGGGGGGGQAVGGGGGGWGGGGGGGLGGGGGGGGGGFFSIPPDRPRKISVKTVCLQHGKPDPKPRMEYRIVPLDVVTKDPRVNQLCRSLANGSISQSSAQAAAWNLMDGLTWQELENKNRVESRYTGNKRYFSKSDVETAVQFVTTLEKRNDESKYSESPVSP